MTRLAALAVWLALGFALLRAPPPTPLPEPTGIPAVRLKTERLPPPPPVTPNPSAPAPSDAAVRKASAQSQFESVPQPVRSVPPLAVARVPAQGSSTPSGAGAGASFGKATEVSTPPSSAASGPASKPSLSATDLAIIKAQACAQIDIKDRPPDCPPNLELKRLLQQARGPKYRPENAEAFSRNELRWRDIPPPCLEDGEKIKMTGSGGCVRFGMIPSRVRSPKEICEARGIGGCAAPPSQAAVNAAAKQTKGQ